MTKSALFLGMMLLSLNVFADSITELKSSLNKLNHKPTPVTAQTLYAGQDMLVPKEINAELKDSQTQVG